MIVNKLNQMVSIKDIKFIAPVLYDAPHCQYQI